MGRRLAALLGVSFRDADAEIEREWGVSIPELLDAGRFRRAEALTLGRLLARSEPVVLSTGGGAVEWDGLRAALEGWRVVWLDAPASVLAARLAADGGGRPSLTGRALEDEIEELRAAREQAYREVAGAYVETHRRTPDEVAAGIQKLLQADHNRKPSNAD